MEIKVLVPQIGQSIAEATIVKWYRQPGEFIRKGETLVEIGTDKVNTEVPAPESGRVEKLLVAEGETVPVQTEIAILTTEAAAVFHREEPARPAGETKEAVQPTIVSHSIRSSPYVRRLAQEHNIDLSRLQGTGSGGRITKEDILKAMEERTGSRSREERVPMSRMRKLIAEHMSLSRHTAADVTTFFEIDMTEVVREREKAKETLEKEYGIKLTYLPFVLMAVVKGLRAFPILNASIEGEDIIYKKDIHLGIAVAVEEGLLVPVIRHADEKNMVGLARALQDLSFRARNKNLKAEELEGGTFTITNPGVFGALMGTPIIHQPQVAILGVGAVVKRPVIINDAIAIRSMCYFSLTYDHRALDGATADSFLAHVKKTLEKECPSALI